MSAIPAVGHVSVRRPVPEDYLRGSISCRVRRTITVGCPCRSSCKLWTVRWLIRQITREETQNDRVDVMIAGFILPGGVALLLHMALGADFARRVSKAT